MTFPNMAPAGNPVNGPGQGVQVPVYGHGGQMPDNGGQPHPTVGNAGMPGAPVTVLPSNNQPPHPTLGNNMPPMGQPAGTVPNGPYMGPGTPGSFAGQQPITGYGPQGQPIYGNPQAPQAPQAPQPTQGWNQPTQPAMQQPGGRVQITNDTILDGPGVPPEFRGRSFGQVAQVYQALATDWMQRNPGAVPTSGNRAAPQHPNAQPTQPNFQGGGQPANGAPANDDTQFWTNPTGFIRQAVQDAVAPVTQQTVATQIAEARRIATTGISDYGVIEGEVMTIISQVDDSQRANPQAWVNAIDLARGRMLRDGRYHQSVQTMRQPNGQPANGYPQNGNPNMPPNPAGGPGNAVPASMVPVYGFFTEQPNGPQAPRAGLTPEQQFYARKFGMSDDEYGAWASSAQNLTPQQSNNGGWR